MIAEWHKTLLMLIVVLGWVSLARADLPGPLPPETPAPDDVKHSKPSPPQGNTVEPAQSNGRAQGPAVNRAVLQEPPAGGPLSLTEPAAKTKRNSSADEAFSKFTFEDLMDSVTSTRQAFPAAFGGQFMVVGVFSKLTFEERRILAPRLLAELKNESKLLGNQDLVDGAPLQVRHVVDMALTRTAGVYFGQFPAMAGRDAPAGQAEIDQQASEKLIGRWNDWWRQVKDADEAAWAATASRLRMPLLDSPQEDLASLNVQLAVEQSDVNSLPTLGRLLERAEIKEISRYEALINQYMALCAQKGAPLEAKLLLVEFLRKHNVKEIAFRTQWLRSVGAVLNKMTGVGADFLEPVEVDLEQNGQKFHTTVFFVRKAALTAWEQALKDAPGDKADAPREEQDKNPKSDKANAHKAQPAGVGSK